MRYREVSHDTVISRAGSQGTIGANRIQLSRPRSTAYGMAMERTTKTQTVSDAVGRFGVWFALRRLNRRRPYKLEVSEGVVKRGMFDPLSDFFGWIYVPPDVQHLPMRPFRVGYCYGIPYSLLRR